MSGKKEVISAVLKKPHLGCCPKKKPVPVCGCVELSTHCGEEECKRYQDTIRQLYVEAMEEGGHSDGNEFLVGCFVPNDVNWNRFTCQVPCIVRGEKSCQRSFTVCAKQFKVLFNLSESRFQRLREKKRGMIGRGCSRFGFKNTTTDRKEWWTADIYFFKEEEHNCRLVGWSFFGCKGRADANRKLDY